MKRQIFAPRRAVVAALMAGGLVLAGCSGLGDDAPAETDGGAETGGEAEAGGDAIGIGMINDTSGGASAYSPYCTEGIEMAIDEINSEGGGDGRQRSRRSESDGSGANKT